jgi:Na+-translocating ferredoxin:NAD+ oxidoreductase RnfG subunit
MRKTLIAVVALMIVTAGTGSVMAGRLMSDDKAVQTLMPGATSVEKVVKPVTAKDLAAITEALGGMLYADGKPGKTPKEYEFQFGMKDGKQTGVVFFNEEPGKWGQIGFAAGLEPVTGKILEMAVTSTTEKRGRPISMKSFLRQFSGKDTKDAFETGKDINAVAGATISTKSAAFAAKKAVVIYKYLFLKK